jgi:2-(3-amino-3-carboxypropyl)histidine synthase
MKTIFITAKSDEKIKIDNAEILPEKIGVVTTIQHLHKIDEIMKILKDAGKKPVKGGQILGCNLLNADKIKNKVDAFLYYGDGLFHPIGIQIKSKKDVYYVDDGKIKKLDDKEIEKFEKRKKGSLIKYYSAQNIGILVSTKPGQNKLEDAKKLKQKIEEQGKKAFIMISNDIDFNQLENFPFVEMWVNTACPRIAYDDYDKFNKPVINIEDIK